LSDLPKLNKGAQIALVGQVLNDGKDLLVGYRLWLQEGEMTVDQAAALSADFVDPPAVTVR